MFSQRLYFFILINIISVLSPALLHANQCQLVELNNIEFRERLRPVQNHEVFFLVIKDSTVLFTSSNKTEIEMIKSSLKSTATCELFSSIKEFEGCTPILSENGAYILSNDKIWFHKMVNLSRAWTDLAQDFRILKNQRECKTIEPWEVRQQYCHLSLPLTSKTDYCPGLCQLALKVSSVERDSTYTPIVKDTSYLHFSRYDIIGLLKDLEFYQNENFCLSTQYQERVCLVLKTANNFSLVIPGVARYELADGMTTLRGMVENSMGGLCGFWEEIREVQLLPVAEKAQDYFSFSIGEIPHRVLNLNDFKELALNLRASKIIPEEQVEICMVSKNDTTFQLQRAGKVIFRTNSHPRILEALSTLWELKLCSPAHTSAY